MSDADYSLSDAQRAHLHTVLDQIIPPSRDRGLPGAGELGLATFIEELLRKSPQQRLAIEPGLAAFAELVQQTGSHTAAMTKVQEQQPAFVPTLVFHTYTGYYQDPRVLVALGLEPRPPHPVGYEMGPSDFSTLERVRQRGRVYRET